MLKRSTPQNIVIGGAAGALPPVIGWVAVTGSIGLPALLLFALVFYWTPPHFWALSLRIRKDYAAAGVPMLPVVKGIPETTRQIALYTVLMVAISLVLFAVARMGAIYLVAAVVLGAIFLWQAYGLWRRGASEEASTAGAIAALQVLDQLPVAAVPRGRRRRAGASSRSESGSQPARRRSSRTGSAVSGPPSSSAIRSAGTRDAAEPQQPLGHEPVPARVAGRPVARGPRGSGPGGRPPRSPTST